MRRLLILLLCLCCSGCTALPAEERAFAVALCVEKPGVWRVHGRIPAYKTGGEYLTVTGEGATLEAAIADMDAPAPMRVLLSQLRLLVLAADAEAADVVAALADRVDIRQQCVLAVTQEKSTDVMKALKPQSGARLSKSIDLLVDTRAGQGRIPRITLAEAACMGERQSPVLPVLTLDKEAVNMAGAWAAGEKFDAMDSTLLAMLLGETTELHLPLGRGSIYVRDVSVKARLEEDWQSATVTLCMDVMGNVPDGTAQALADASAALLARLSANGCDALGLARQAICHARDMEKWHALNWPARYREIRWNVEIGINGPA